MDKIQSIKLKANERLKVLKGIKFNPAVLLEYSKIMHCMTSSDMHS